MASSSVSTRCSESRGTSAAVANLTLDNSSLRRRMVTLREWRAIPIPAIMRSVTREVPEHHRVARVGDVLAVCNLVGASSGRPIAVRLNARRQQTLEQKQVAPYPLVSKHDAKTKAHVRAAAEP